MSRTEPLTRARPFTVLSRRDHLDLADWLLRRGLAWMVGLLCLLELGAWLPGYLTWPWWADHDVFATMARGWDGGLLPYRDLLGNNFPGTIYLFWLLGKLGGWGNTANLWAADAAFVVILGIALLGWSRRRFDSSLPGLIGYAAFLGYYLNLDYSQAAQRDWHAPFFGVLALLILQTWPGRTGRIVSALALATALLFRPQAVLFAPAILLAVVERDRPSTRRVVGSLVVWGLVVTLGVILGFLPLILAGVGDEFLRGVRLASFGASYNTTSGFSVLKELLDELLDFRFVLPALASVSLIRNTSPALRSLTRTWLVALVFVAFYKPISPVQHAYLSHPLMLVWAVNLAVLTALLLKTDPPRLLLTFVAVLLVLALAVPERPRFSNPAGIRQSVASLRQDRPPLNRPAGYSTHLDSPAAGRYEWDDYRRVLNYLKHDLGPNTRIANALRYAPALTGPTGRLPAFPAESTAWLRVVRPEDEPRFVRSLEQSSDSVVVWDPRAPDPPVKLERLHAAIERLYEPAARFGIIEVWRRKSISR